MPRGLAQALDIVEGALLREKDVDDEVDVVEQDPFALALALASTVALAQDQINFADLPLVPTATPMPNPQNPIPDQATGSAFWVPAAAATSAAKSLSFFSIPSPSWKRT